MRAISAAAIAFVAGLALGYILHTEKPTERVVTTRSVSVDTLRCTIPKEVNREIIRTITQSVAVHHTDTLTDSVFVELPIEQSIYADSSYKAWVSGYRAKLDSIEVYQRTERITTQIERTIADSKRWGIGLSAGYGYAPQYGFTPFVGVTLNYNIIRF